MKYSNWLRAGAVGVLGALGGLGCDTASQPPKDSVVQSAYSRLSVPQLSNLQRKVSAFSPEAGNREELLKQADYGGEFHSSFSLFVANSTLGVSSWFTYDFENDRKVDSYDVDRLTSTAGAVRANTPGRCTDCTAAEELHGILKKAEKEGHLNEAVKVMGYLDRVSSRTGAVFSGFKFFYGNDPNRKPKEVWEGYIRDAREIRNMESRASTAFSSLSEKVRNELVMWVGRYGHGVLQDKITETGVRLSPAAPTSGQDTFYRQLGEDLLKGYGLITNS